MRLAVVVLVALASCSRGRRAPPGAGEAHRIVSVTPATTEVLFALGAGDRVVGRSRFCDYPPEATHLPMVGGFIDVDLEAVLQLEPDLVVGAAGPSSARLQEQLAARGVATWFPHVDSFADVDALIAGMGQRTNHAAQARQVVAGVDDGARDIERSVAALRAPRVLVVIDVGPVVAVGPGDFVDEMIRRAHATNVLRQGGPWQTLGFEQIVELDPDVVVDGSVVESGRATTITPRASGWSDVRAVREGHVVPIADPRVLRPGPRVSQGLATMARALHPDAAVPAL